MTEYELYQRITNLDACIQCSSHEERVNVLRFMDKLGLVKDGRIRDIMDGTDTREYPEYMYVGIGHARPNQITLFSMTAQTKIAYDDVAEIIESVCVPAWDFELPPEWLDV